MKKLSELSIADLIAIHQYVSSKIDEQDLSVKERVRIIDKLNLVQVEINRRLGEIDFEA
jgi:hypothetical protein